MSNVAMNLVATMMQRNFGQTGVNATKTFQKTEFSKYMDQANNKPKTREDEYVDAGFSTSDRPSSMNEGTRRDNVSDDRSKRADAISNNKDESFNQRQVSKKDESSKTQETSETKQDVKVESLNEEEAVAIEQEVLDAVAKELNITPDELNAMLQSLGMTVTDLLNSENVTTLVMEHLGMEDSMELVTTEGAVELLQATKDAVSSLVEQNIQQLELSEQDVTIEEFQTMIREKLEESSTQGNANQENSKGNLQSESPLSNNQTQVDNTQVTSGFEGALNQVITQKTETIVMNGQTQTIYTEVSAKDVFDQIVTGMKVEVTEGASKMVLQLEPEHLGKIALNISTANGAVSGHFIAESEAVKEIIEANLSTLKNQLSEQGLDVQDIKITVGSSESYFTGEDGNNKFSGENSNKKGNKKHHIGNVNGIFADNISDESMMIHESTMMENSSIELQA